MIYLIILFISISITALFFLFRHPVQPTSRNSDNTASDKKKPKLPCILCKTQLYGRENLKSEKYVIGDETIVHTFGCPHCYGPKRSKQRHCPVCGRLMKEDEYLIGKMWTKKSGKLHLHLSGCNRCSRIS